MQANEFGMLPNVLLGEYTSGETFVGYAGRKVKNEFIILLHR